MVFHTYPASRDFSVSVFFFYFNLSFALFHPKRNRYSKTIFCALWACQALPLPPKFLEVCHMINWFWNSFYWLLAYEHAFLASFAGIFWALSILIINDRYQLNTKMYKQNLCQDQYLVLRCVASLKGKSAPNGLGRKLSNFGSKSSSLVNWRVLGLTDISAFFVIKIKIVCPSSAQRMVIIVTNFVVSLIFDQNAK